MGQRLVVACVVAVAGFIAPVTTHSAASQEAGSARQEHPSSPHRKAEARLTKQQRADFIRRAQLWQPTDVETMDLRRGPGGSGAFEPDALVTCTYVETKLSGASRKFECAREKNDIVKVRYGDTNGEVMGSVLAGRLLWALGFGADRVYPVRVRCLGCSADPFVDRKPVNGEHLFELAVIERKPEGDEMTVEGDDAGWSWSELASIDESAGGAPRAHRDALMLLAIVIQHTDSKPKQQRLVCLPGGLIDDGVCQKPFLMLHDVGLTFGHGNLTNREDVASVNFDRWSKTPVWRGSQGCVGHMSKSFSGTLGNPQISEAGRAFLAERLARLSEDQLRDLFEVARVERRSRKPDGATATASADVDQWIAAFNQKREEIASRRCPN
jgi:hypothetical protein